MDFLFSNLHPNSPPAELAGKAAEAGLRILHEFELDNAIKNYDTSMAGTPHTRGNAPRVPFKNTDNVL